MRNHEIDLKSGCVYLCRVVDGYDGWKAVAECFSEYGLFQLKLDFYNAFKDAVTNLKEERMSECIANISFTYEHFNDIIDGLFYAAVAKGVVVIPESIPPPLFPHKWEAKYGTAEEMVMSLNGMYQAWEMRDFLWDIFQNSLILTGSRGAKKDRKKLIRLYEYLTDLATAAYVISIELDTESKSKS